MLIPRHYEIKISFMKYGIKLNWLRDRKFDLIHPSAELVVKFREAKGWVGRVKTISRAKVRAMNTPKSNGGVYFGILWY